MLEFELLGYFSKKENVYIKLSTSPPCRDTWLSSINNRMILFRVEICWFLRSHFTEIRHFKKIFQEIENSFIMEKIVSFVSEHLQTRKDFIRKDFAKCLVERSGKSQGEYI